MFLIAFAIYKYFHQELYNVCLLAVFSGEVLGKEYEGKKSFLVYCVWLKAVALNCLCIVQKSLHAIFCSSTNLQVLSPSKHSDYHKMHACTDGVGVYMKSSPLINMQMHIANCKNAFAAWLQNHATNTLLVTMPWDLGIVRSRASVYPLLPFPSYCQSFFILRSFKHFIYHDFNVSMALLLGSHSCVNSEWSLWKWINDQM